MALGTVSIDLEARLAKFESDIGRAARLLEREMSRSAAKTERAIGNMQRQIDRDMRRVQQSARTAAAAVLGFFSIQQGVRLARDLGRVADQYANIQSKVKLAAGENANLAQSLERVYKVSQSTFQSFDGTTRLVQRTAQAFRGFGQSNEEAFNNAIRLAEVFNKALTVSGASQQEATASAIQFSQAIASGRLQGDEFRSVLENNSRFAQLLADSLGVTIGGLYELRTAGKLGVDALLGVVDATAKLDAEFSQVPLTIARAYQQLTNAFTKFVGEADQARGVSLSIAQGIQVIAENIGPLVTSLATLATAVVATFGARTVAAIFNYVAALRASVAATAEQAAAQVASSQQSLFKARATQLDAAATVQATRTELARTEAVLAGTLAQQAAIRTNALKATSEIELARLSQALTAAEVAQTAASNALGAARQRLVAANAELVIANRALAAAHGQVAAATAAATAATVGATGVMARFGSGLLALVGGPIGAFAIAIGAAAYGFYQLATAQSQVEQASTAVQKAIDDLKTSTKETAAAALAAADAERDRAKALLQVAEAELKRRQAFAEQATTGRAQEGMERRAIRQAREVSNLRDDIARLNAEIAAAERKLVDYGEIIDGTTRITQEATEATEAFTPVVADLGASIESTGETVDEFREKIDRLLESVEDSQLNKIADDMAQLQIALDMAIAEGDIERANRLTEALAALSDRVSEVPQEAAAASDGFDYMLDAGMEAARELESYFTNATSSISRALGDFITGGIDSFKDFGATLVDITRQMVSDIIAMFLRMNVIGPIVSSVFASMGGVATAGGFGSGAYGSIMGGGIPGMSWSSLTGLFGGGGMNASAMQSYGVLNTPTGTFQGLGPWGTAMAGLGGAWYGYNRTNGGLAGLGAAGAYGALGIGAAGTAAGVAGGASLGAAAGGAFASLGSAAWIPVVGWIAAIAALVDLASGGRLFGTDWEPTDIESTLSLADGGTASTTLGEVRQRSLFRGRKWRDREIENSEEIEEAAREFYESVLGSMTSAAEMLAVDVPEMIDAELRVFQALTDKGKPKGDPQFFVDYMGRTWEEATQEAAAQRIGAESIIAVVESAFEGTSQLAEPYRDTVEQLAQFADFALMAATDIKAGVGLLGEDSSLGGVLDLVEELAVSGETLAATYSRLQIGTQLLEQAFDGAGIAVDMAREDFVRFAADIVEAAGGLERAQALWTNYFEQFYSDVERAQMALDAANRAAQGEFDDVGLNLADFTGEGGAEAFRRLFESVLPTLSADAVVEWLEAAAALGIVIDLTEQYNAALGQTQGVFDVEAAGQYAEFMMAVNDQLRELDGVSEFQMGLRDIAAQMNANIDQANQLARAAGLQGAREEDLARIHELAARQAAQALRQLESASQALANDLGYTALGQIEAQIAELEAQSNGAGNALSSLGNAISEAGSIASEIANAILSDFSPLRGQAKADFALAALGRGEVSLDQALRVGREVFASGSDFNDFFDQALRLARSAPTGSGGTGGVSNAQLERLYRERERLLAEQEATNRRILAGDLAQNVADIAGVTGESFEEVAERLGFSLDQLSVDLGVPLEDLGAYLETLQAGAYDLATLAEQLHDEFDYFLTNLQLILQPPEATPIGTATKPELGFAAAPIPQTIAVPSKAEAAERMERTERRHVELLNEIRRIAHNTGATADETGNMRRDRFAAGLEADSTRPRSIPRRNDRVYG